MVWEWNLSPGFWIQSQCSFCPTILPSQRSEHHLRWSSLHKKWGSQIHETQWLLKEWKVIWQSILLAPEGTILNCLSPVHTLSHTHTHTHTHTLNLNLFIKSIDSMYRKSQDFPGGAPDKEPTCQCRRCQRCEFSPRVGRIPWRRKWQPIPVFWPGEFHGQMSLVGYSP